MPVRTLVLVEGESDLAAVRALARLVGCDLDPGDFELQAANGVTNFARALSEFLRATPDGQFCGLYDVAEERYVRSAVSRSGVEAADDLPLESLGFFACAADLEDELIGALGTEAVERLIEARGELASFRRFQAMPQHQGTPTRQQLRRFLGTRATRKIRMAPRLVEALAPSQLPRPLAGLAARLLRASARAAGLK